MWKVTMTFRAALANYLVNCFNLIEWRKPFGGSGEKNNSAPSRSVK